MCLIIASILSNSLACADSVDGDSLINSLKGNDHENINSLNEFFNGYISGVADATANDTWCPPHDLNGSQLQKITINYYKAHSNEASASAKDLILHALVDAYPCEK